MFAKIAAISLLVAAANGLAISVAGGGLNLGNGLLNDDLLDHGLSISQSPITIAHQPLTIAHQPIAISQPLAIAHQPLAIAHQPIAIAHQPAVDLHAPANYQFKYGVHDPHTGDNKQQSESRVGDTVKGEYSLAEPDGTIRVVKYTADPHNGFNAVVSRVGHAAHPQILRKSVAVAAPTLVSAHGLGLDLRLH
ncbi:unnamed protein product [Phyllotreta striolata]|uniref:Uncharacterized protein n=1 Tax=Phyllotreta striolata TaxID=444603 RepID=A0A9N9TPN0_PHYSR|nr:unnamed protein product [Phyllotreta striolata]